MSIENTTAVTTATAIATGATATTATTVTFATLGLNPLILKAVEESGYTVPTPIQAQAIPEVLAGHDMMASAQTGTGKTAAFILPALHRIAEPSAVKSKGPRVLVLTPTRELAQQVSEAASKYGKNMRLKVVSILGGMPYPLQNKLLSSPVDILVATPGRLIDHIERGRIDFSRLEMLILDEADRMLDMGFIDDVERIAAATPATRQTLLFSATLDGVIGNLAQRLLKSPKRISVTASQARHENIDQRLMYVDDMAHKNRLLDHLLRDTEMNQALVFTATKRDADALADGLSAQGHSVAALHGDMNQRERNRTLTNLRRGQVRILVATDVAARGIDVAGISHVINFDLPKFAEDYVHRIGRTGRGGASGIAVSFASNRDAVNLHKIERYTGQSITAHTVAGLEPKFKPRSGGSASPRGNASPRGKSGGFGRHTAPDSRHGFPPRDDRSGNGAHREGQTHNRFGDNAQRRTPNTRTGAAPSTRSATPGNTTGAAGGQRRPASSFSLGRGNNGNTNGNR